MDELISIIINVYNGEKYIKKCLDSVVNQTYKNIEIIIVNDGSTDNTLSICESYKDKRIKIINQKNIGISLSRNVGIESAKGNYLFFVDSDDFIEIDTIEYLYRLSKKYNAKMSVATPLQIYNYDFKKTQKKESIKIISGKEFTKKILLSIDHTGNIWNKLMSRDIFENGFKFENRPISDVAVIYKITLSIDRIVYSNQIKYYYYRHKDSILGKKEPKRQIDFYKASLDRYNYINNKYKNTIENKIGLDYVIMELYIQNNPIVIKYLNEQNAIKVFKEKFTINILFSKIKFREKIKIILFRISPKFCLLCIKKYLKIKFKFRK